MIHKFLIVFLFIYNAYGVTHEVIARANSYGSFRLPYISYISNSTIKQNSIGDVTFSFIAVIDQEVKQGIWYSPNDSSKGKVIHYAKVGNYLSDPEVNENGVIVFSEYNEASIEGLYKYDTTTDIFQKSSEFKNLDALRDPKVNNFGDIIFRGTNREGSKGIYLFKNEKLENIVMMNDSIHSYLFSASFNGENSIVLKTRLGHSGQLSDSRPDKIKRFDFYREETTLISDSDSDSNSVHDEINNSIGSNSNSLNFAFISKGPDAKRALYVQKGLETIEIAKEGEGQIKVLEYFTPSVNSKGHVAFRAIGNDGKRKVFWSNGKVVKAFISKGDLIDTDTVTGRIHSGNGPAFGGGVSLNENDQVVFQAKVYSKNLEKDLGSIVLRSSF